jgi:2-oxoisovalerate dehydrogenase E1 component
MTNTHPEGHPMHQHSNDELLAIYRTMRRIRAVDERCRRGLKAGEFAFSMWSPEGQEAISAGTAAALRPDDQWITTYRCIGDAVAKGVTTESLVGEFLGTTIGTSGGRGGAMGVNAPDVGLMATTGIVGAGPPIANGFAWADQLQGRDRVTVVSFGDGATSIGFVHEAMNLAAVWKLPVIFLCQNNLYGEATPLAGYTATQKLSDRAAGYGMPGVTIDGTDPLAVCDAVADATRRARAGDGPTMIEAVAHRLSGHYFGDPCVYVDQEQLAEALENEPLKAFRNRLLDEGIDAAELDRVDEQELAAVDASVEKAKAAPPPDPDSVFTHVYAGTNASAELTTSPPRSHSVPVGPTTDMGLAGAVNSAMRHALASDPRVVILGEDIADPMGGLFKATAGLSTDFGDRVRSTPISETAILGAAIGAAAAGMRPVAEIMFCDFLGVCMDQLVNHAAKLRYMTGGRVTAPITVRTVVGTGNGPQHSQSFEAWAMHVPGLKVVFPSNPADAKGLLAACIDDEDPCVFLEGMSLLFTKSAVPDEPYTLPLGSAVITRPGTDVTVISWGPMVGTAHRVAKSVAEDGISVEVVDLRTLLPLDLPTILDSVGRTRRAVIAHGSVGFAGAGAEIAAQVNEELFGELEAPVTRVAAAFTPVPHAAGLIAAHQAGRADLEAAVRQAAG